MTVLRLTLPLYVREGCGETGPEYRVRPLFFAEPCERGDTPGRACARLVGAVRNHLQRLAQSARLDELAAWTFCPEMEDSMVEVPVDMGRRTVGARLLVALFSTLGRRMAYVPALPDPWVEIPRGQGVAERVGAVARHFWGHGARREGDVSPHDLSARETAWVSTLEVTVDVPAAWRPPPTDARLATLEGAPVRSGAEEIQRVGRCLDWLYPDDLERSVRREAEVEALERALATRERRPVLVVGPRRVGKTALIHEWVHRRHDGGAGTSLTAHGSAGARGEVWLVSGQRLVSGMSWLGQWEARLLGILQHCREHDHVLYVDDVPGLHVAGVSRDSRLSVADVLETSMQRRHVRVLGEITPDALRVLRERDRAFVDLFHLVRLDEPPTDETLRILLHVVREVERQHGCIVQAEALACLLELQRRFVRDAAFPGKAATVLRHMGARLAGATIGREQVMEDFSARTGLVLDLLDEGRRLERARVVQELRQHVVGQDAALEAAADVISVAKARLEDPDRPLGVFLFVGPTGVGKTRTARALATWLFGSEDRLVRLDMNELASDEAVARLVGTLEQPDGLLTGALRRQPFAVVLLDEIEKAGPALFPMLLQVLGEGRLTDALGRTADFTQAIIVMTSNLGAAETSRPLGLRAADATSDQLTYLRAAQRFFSPELFNRIDRVVPFVHLPREAVRQIAQGLVEGVLHREGVTRRRCIVCLDDGVVERLAEQGFDAAWGARALKRAVERLLVKPLAACLACLPPQQPALVDVLAGEEIRVEVLPLVCAGPEDHLLRVVAEGTTPEVVSAVEQALKRIEAVLDRQAPTGVVASDDLGPELAHHFACCDQVRRVRTIFRRVTARVARGGGRRAAATAPRRAPVAEGAWRGALLREPLEKARWRSLLQADDIRSSLAAAVGEAQGRRTLAGAGADLEDDLVELLREVAWLDLMVGPEEPGDGDVYLAVPERFGGARTQEEATVRARLLEVYTEMCERGFDFEVERVSGPLGVGLRIRGHRAGTLLLPETGLTLFYGDSPGDVLRAARVRVMNWSALAGPLDDDGRSDRLEVVRIHDARAGTVDVRTGWLAAPNGEATPSAADLRLMLLALLPPPSELFR